MAWKIKLFQTSRGEYPVNEFIKELDEASIARVSYAIDLLENYGPFLKPPEIKKVQSDLYELRVRGKVQVRILYTIHKSEFYLLHAFKKKTQKTLARELKVALDRMKKII